MEPANIIAVVEERRLFLRDFRTFGDFACQLRRGFGGFHFVLKQDFAHGRHLFVIEAVGGFVRCDGAPFDRSAAVETFAVVIDQHRRLAWRDSALKAPFDAVGQPRRAGKPNEDEIVFLFCGQMIARKGVDILLEAFSELARRSEQRARLLLVGLATILNSGPGKQ